MTENIPPQEPEPGNVGTQPPPSPHSGPRVSGEEMRDLARLRRSSYDKHVAGVAGGLGRHLDMDPVILRVAFVVLTFFGGAGLILYVACWLIVPDDQEQVTFRLDARSRTVALFGIGILAGLALVGDAWGPGWFPWPLLVIGLIAWLILSRRDRQAPAAPATQWHGGAMQGWAGAPAEGPQAPPPGTPGTAWNYNVGAPHHSSPRPRNPRKRGPILFWFTLGLIALGLGTLGIVDLAGVDVIGSAYPALALGIIAVMLVVGAFYGRAGGLILLGLVTAAGLTLGTVVDRFEGTEMREQPTSAADVDAAYTFDAGELELDLTQVENLDELDGRTIDIDVDLGRVEVIVPRELSVDVESRIGAGGNISLFGENRDGWDFSFDRRNDGPDGAPQLTIDAEIGFGEIEVSTR